MATPTTLPATFVSGDVLTATQMNNLRGAFRVLQVIYGETTTAVDSSSTTYADTGLTATITPSSTSSKVLVLVNQNGLRKSPGNTENAINIRVLRGATQINQNLLIGYTNSLLDLRSGSFSVSILDSPATTSATTYKTTFSNNSATAVVTVQQDSSRSTMILMEISA